MRLDDARQEPQTEQALNGSVKVLKTFFFSPNVKTMKQKLNEEEPLFLLIFGTVSRNRIVILILSSSVF